MVEVLGLLLQFVSGMTQALFQALDALLHHGCFARHGFGQQNFKTLKLIQHVFAVWA